MDPKTEAKELREIANLYDQIAERRDAIGVSAEGARMAARENRVRADELDPPLHEWQDGDYVRDKNGGVWRHDGSFWRSAGGAYVRVSDLPALYGPIHKVNIADPAKQEVVVSLDGIDRVTLDRRADESEDDFTWPAARASFRAAKAAREQLGEVQ